MVDQPWYRAAERLVTEIGRLVDERDALLVALRESESEREEAHARVDELEALNRALERELFGSKGKANKRAVGHMAAAITFVAAQLLGGFLQSPGAEAYQHVRGVVDHSAAVAVACDIHIEVDLHNVIASDEAHGKEVEAIVAPTTVESHAQVPEPSASSTENPLIAHEGADEERPSGAGTYGSGTYGGGGPVRPPTTPPMGDDGPAPNR